MCTDTYTLFTVYHISDSKIQIRKISEISVQLHTSEMKMTAVE